MKTHKSVIPRAPRERVLKQNPGPVIHPLHISMIALPDTPIAKKISPEILRSIVTSPQYKDYRNSIKFGTGKVLKGRWWIWVIIAVVVMLVALASMGYIPGM